MRLLLRIVVVVFGLATVSFAHAGEKVIASIKPLHSLVAGVMEGVGTPALIIDGTASPHAYSLKPSQARALQDAELIFWMGPEIESALEKPVETLGASAKVVNLLEAQGLDLLALREGGSFEDHEHDDHKHDDHNEEARGEEAFDLHVWLDPENARAMVSVIAEALSSSDPENAVVYGTNARALVDRLQVLEAEILDLLEPVKDRPFIVFHDAYQYFEYRFGLKSAGALTINPDVIPGAGRIGELRKTIKRLGAVCIFSEPQYAASMIATVTEGTAAKSGILDPLGSAFENGTELYFKLLREMAGAFRACLG